MRELPVNGWLPSSMLFGRIRLHESRATAWTPAVTKLIARKSEPDLELQDERKVRRWRCLRRDLHSWKSTRTTRLRCPCATSSQLESAAEWRPVSYASTPPDVYGAAIDRAWGRGFIEPEFAGQTVLRGRLGWLPSAVRTTLPLCGSTTGVSNRFFRCLTFVTME